MNTYAEVTERLQTEFLESLKQAQELNLNTLRAVSDLIAHLPTPKADGSGLPSATEAVEQGFSFANRVLETRKEFALKLAKLATETQKQFAENLARFAETSKN